MLVNAICNDIFLFYNTGTFTLKHASHETEPLLIQFRKMTWGNALDNLYEKIM